MSVLPHHRIELTPHPLSKAVKDCRGSFIFSLYSGRHCPSLVTWNPSSSGLHLANSCVDMFHPLPSRQHDYSVVSERCSKRHLHVSVPRPRNEGHWNIYGHRCPYCAYSQVFEIYAYDNKNVRDNIHFYYSNLHSPAPFTIAHPNHSVVYFLGLVKLEVFDLTIMDRIHTVEFPHEKYKWAGIREAKMNSRGDHLYVLVEYRYPVDTCKWGILVIDTQKHEPLQMIETSIRADDLFVCASEDDHYMYILYVDAVSYNFIRYVRQSSSEYILDDQKLDLYSAYSLYHYACQFTVHGSNILVLTVNVEYMRVTHLGVLHWDSVAPTIRWIYILDTQPDVLQSYCFDLTSDGLLPFHRGCIYYQATIDAHHHLLYIVSDHYIWAYDYIHHSVLLQQTHIPSLHLDTTMRIKYAAELSPDCRYLAVFAYDGQNSVLDIFDVQEVVWKSQSTSVMSLLCDPTSTSLFNTSSLYYELQEATVHPSTQAP